LPAVLPVVDVVRAVGHAVLVQVAAHRHERLGPGGRRTVQRRRVAVFVRVLAGRTVRVTGRHTATPSRRREIVTVHRQRRRRTAAVAVGPVAGRPGVRPFGLVRFFRIQEIRQRQRPVRI